MNDPREPDRMIAVARNIVCIGAVSAALAVALGAFGAHVLDGRISDGMMANYETGARYHLSHSLGIIGVGLLALLHGRHTHDRRAGGGRGTATSMRLRWSAVLMLTGVVLFSGSLYTMALTGQRWLGAVTPLGGVSLLAAWGLLAWAALDS